MFGLLSKTAEHRVPHYTKPCPATTRHSSAHEHMSTSPHRTADHFKPKKTKSSHAKPNSRTIHTIQSTTSVNLNIGGTTVAIPRLRTPMLLANTTAECTLVHRHKRPTCQGTTTPTDYITLPSSLTKYIIYIVLEMAPTKWISPAYCIVRVALL